MSHENISRSLRKQNEGGFLSVRWNLSSNREKLSPSPGTGRKATSYPALS